MLGALADFKAAQEEYEDLVSQRAASRDPTRRWLEGVSPCASRHARRSGDLIACGRKVDAQCPYLLKYCACNATMRPLRLQGVKLIIMRIDNPGVAGCMHSNQRQKVSR